MTGRAEAELSEVPDHRRPAGLQVVEHARKQLADDLHAGRQQVVGVPALRHTPPVRRRLRKRVTLHHRDTLVCLRHHPGSEKSRDTGPGHRMVTDHSAP